MHGSPWTTWEFKSTSALTDVAAWYAKELGDRHWVGGLQPNTEGPGGGATYFWQRPCLSLSLDDYPPIEGRTHYKVTLGVQGGCQWQSASAAQSLRDEPESSLAPSGAQATGAETSGARAQPDGTILLWVEQSYRWTGTRAQVLEYYDSTLTRLGWTRIDPLASQPLATAAAGKWRKGLLVAVVKFEGFAFDYGLSESLDSKGSPMPPPSGPSLP